MKRWAAALGATLALSGANAQGLLDFSAEELARITAHGPWPARAPADASNRAQARPAAAAWGRELFFDPALSADRSRACASCHMPGLAWQDGRVTAQGRASGRRNTPSLLNAAQWRWFGWDGAHDSLWAASLAPLLEPDEMGHDVASLAAALRTRPNLAVRWRAAFGAPVPDDEDRLIVGAVKALAAWQATLVSPRSDFDRFRDALLRGDRGAAARYPLPAQRGLKLFVGEGRCSVCHAGPMFSNGEFGDVGVPFFVPGGVDPGRHAGLQKLLASRMNRLGPFNEAGAADPRAVTTRHLLPLHRHFGEFRVPSLRSVALTAPYMHDGSLAALEDVVRHYSELDEERLHVDGERILRPLRLTPQQAADLAAFLRSL